MEVTVLPLLMIGIICLTFISLQLCSKFSLSKEADFSPSSKLPSTVPSQRRDGNFTWKINVIMHQEELA